MALVRLGADRHNGGVDVVADLEASCSPTELFAVVGDLGRYPDWLSIVPRAVPEVAGADGAPAWAVELRGRLGPLARSKRLRMVRTAHDPPMHVRFERREHDGREHSAWVLDASVHEHPDGARLEMRLHYGGSFGGVLLERMLRDEIERSKPRLLALVDSVAR